MQGIKATASGAVVLYGDLTPNLKRFVAIQFAAEVSLIYHVQSGELQEPKREEASSIEMFFQFLEELLNTFTRHFQRGMNSRQLVQLTLSSLERR